MRTQVLNLSRYASLSPNKMRTHFFCNKYNFSNSQLLAPPHTEIPYAKWLSNKVWYKLLCKFFGILSLICFSIPIQHLSLFSKYAICGFQDNLSSIMTPKNFVSCTCFILCQLIIICSSVVLSLANDNFVHLLDVKCI